MSKYTETTVSAAAYQRCKKITIYNPYQEAPTVQFEEEQIIKRADNSVLKDPQGTITMLVNNFNDSFPVYNPLTQAKTGTNGTIAQLYALVWSVYMHQAVQRDAHLAKVAVEQAAQTASNALRTQHQADIAALSAAFDAADATDLAAAEALAATKATQEEKDVVMADYQTAREVKVVAVNAAIDAANNTYNAAVVAASTKAATDAQVAYDAVMNA